ncbi:MAG TPA: FAD-dependent oxidoreductase [Candidatus Agrococcus pullicola]|uniref:FAD-dependent oxidoreductase n=1 Tax=Candidatus Agrococcus pullicola TaxID=2838429 RepID=A0A9D1YWJ8_9MICO|nr:FAD-dependent oxidoreductase [Candidatus Agrococcus pullicola]
MNSEERSSESLDVAVLGGSLAGLVAARDLARRGYRVLVIEESDAIGGSAAGLALGDFSVSARAEGFVDETGALRELGSELGLGTTTPMSATTAIRLPGRTVPMPENTVFGIPGAPLAKDVVDVLGWSGALRAYGDRLRPVLKIGRYDELGSLVRGRMGRQVVDRMLEPVTRAVFGTHVDSLRVADALPELNGAITRSGSLSGAISMLRADLDADDIYTTRDFDGGLHAFVNALVTDAEDYHAIVRLGESVDLAARDDEGWLLTLNRGAEIRAQAIVVADTESAAPHRVALLVPDTALATPDAPRFSRFFIAPAEQKVRCVELIDATSMWGVGPDGAAVLLLSYRDESQQPGAAATTGAALVEQAIADAETLLGIRIGTPMAAAHTGPRVSRPALEPDEGIHSIGASASLSEVVQRARDAAAAVRRDDFAVPGVSWTERINADAAAADGEGTTDIATMDNKEAP